MKNLANYVIEVSNAREREIALTFYQRATKRPLNPIVNRTGSGRYVGLMTDRTVTCGEMTFDWEQPVPFSQMATLADTPTRKRALKSVPFKA